MLWRILTSGFVAAGLMLTFFAKGPSILQKVASVLLFPGFFLVGLLFPLVPTSALETLADGPAGDDYFFALYIGASVECAFVFWWVSIFLLLERRASRRSVVR